MKTIALIVLMLVSSGLSAAQLYTENSKQGESVDDFVLRIAARAVAYTLANNVEVCGAIGKDESGYTLVITTDGDSMECRVHTVAGKFTGEIFHTHTSKGNDGWANADLNHPGYLATKRKLLWQNQNKMRKIADF